MRILFVDDSPLDSRVTHVALSMIDDAVVLDARDGQAALDLAEEFDPDLLLVDWTMPGMSGRSFITTYREGGGNARIIVTAHEAERPEMIDALRAGANHYVLKPFAPATLHRCIERVMSRGR